MYWNHYTWQAFWLSLVWYNTISRYDCCFYDVIYRIWATDVKCRLRLSRTSFQRRIFPVTHSHHRLMTSSNWHPLAQGSIMSIPQRDKTQVPKHTVLAHPFRCRLRDFPPIISLYFTVCFSFNLFLWVSMAPWRETRSPLVWWDPYLR